MSDSVYNDSMHSLNNSSSHRLRRAALAWPSTRGSLGGEARTVKSIMKVHSLEDSLHSCKEKNKTSPRSKTRRSIRFKSVRAPSLRHGSATSHVSSLIQSIIHPGLHRDASGPGSERTAKPDEDSESAKARSSKHVSFSSVHIRNFKSDVGDNPGVSSGPALSIGWEYTQEPTVDFEVWEAKRGPRLKMKEMALSRREREERLRASGIKTSELARMTKSVNVAKKKRKRTLEMMSKHHRIEEAMENVSFRLKKIVGMRKNDEDEEDELWTKANSAKRSSSAEFMSLAYIPSVGDNKN